MGWAHRNLIWITMVQVIGLFAATVAGGILAAHDYGKLWTEQRKTAEGYRIQIFEAVYNLTKAPPLLRQFLDFFRRYQLDLQTSYYTARGKQQQAGDVRLIWFTALLAGLAAVTGIIGSLNSVDVKFSVLAAFLGIAIPILLSAVQSWRTTLWLEKGFGLQCRRTWPTQPSAQTE